MTVISFLILKEGGKPQLVGRPTHAFETAIGGTLPVTPMLLSC